MLRHIWLTFALLFASGAWAQDAPFASFDLASEPVLNDPHDIEIGPDGHLYVADKFGHRIAVMDAETLELLWTFGDGTLSSVHDISFGPDGLAYVAVSGASRVDVFEIEGESATRVASIGAVSRTEGVLAHSNGRVYAMASGTGEVIAFEKNTAVAGAGGMFGAHDVAEAPDGSIWIADNQGRRLVNLDQDLKYIRQISAPKFGFVGPRYLDVDDFGRLIVADQDAHRVLLIDPNGAEGGTLLGVLGDGSPGLGQGKFDDPEGAEEFGGRYYFADSDNNRIVRYSVVLN